MSTVMQPAPDSHSPAERWRIAASRAVAAGLALLLLISETGWHAISVTAAHAVSVFGIVLAMTGAIGRLWCSGYISGNKNRRLVTDGPYSLCRNPLYFFSFVGAVGVGLTTETATIPLVLTLAFALYYPAVIRSEEARLAELHGDAFTAYRRTVPRFWPSLAHYREPERAEISLIAFRRSLTEVVWFVAAALLCHGLDDLRVALGSTGWMKVY